MNNYLTYFLVMFLSFIISLILGKIILKFLNKKKFYQSISKTINYRHLLKKNTPTFGGFIFAIPPLLVLFIYFIITKKVISSSLFLIIFSFLLYLLIGFIDDVLKIKYQNNKGLSITLKFFYQMVVAIIFFYIFMLTNKDTTISFFNYYIDLKWLYGIFILFFLAFTTNAVNITDGLDGLAGGISILVFIFYGIMAISKNYLLGYNQIALFCFSIAGSLIGFLFYNFFPAKIFMGDLGSLSLGAAAASVAITLKSEVSLFIIGFVFVIEILSSFFQIIFIKLFSKKIFLKAPLHHHFEEKGYNEISIIKMFYLLGLLCFFICLIIFVFNL